MRFSNRKLPDSPADQQYVGAASLILRKTHVPHIRECYLHQQLTVNLMDSLAPFLKDQTKIYVTDIEIDVGVLQYILKF